MKELKWFDECHYYVDLDLTTKEEMQELWKMTRTIDMKWHTSAWEFDDNKLSIKSVVLDDDLDLKLQFVHLIGKIENRINEEDFFCSGDDTVKQIQKYTYYQDR